MNDLETLKEIEVIDLKITNIKTRFLQSNGWTFSCVFPGCCSLWCKVLKDRTVCVTFNDAYKIQKTIMYSEAKWSCL